MAKRMKGRLTPDEWRPIIASALIYERRLAPKLKWRAILNIVVPVAASYLGLGVAYGLSRNIWIGGLFLGIPLLLLLFGLNRITPYQKEARLRADLRATSLVERAFFLDVLRKIQSLGMEDVENRERQAAKDRVSEFPSISERLSNLGLPTLGTNLGMN